MGCQSSLEVSFKILQPHIHIIKLQLIIYPNSNRNLEIKCDIIIEQRACKDRKSFPVRKKKKIVSHFSFPEQAVNQFMLISFLSSIIDPQIP